MHKLNLLVSANNDWRLQRRQFRSRQRKVQIFEDMGEREFMEHFRLNKGAFQCLCNDLECLTNLRDTEEHSMKVKVLCALAFYATGSYQRIVGLSQHLSQKTVSRFVGEVTEALDSDQMAEKWISFPNTRQKRNLLTQEFHRNYQLPGVIGLIDCTHVAIIRPVLDEHLYFNRKGYHSINVQMICDNELRIINVNTKFGGATHDAFIWSSSKVEQYMRSLFQSGEQVWLLGDSGYPLRPWLLTPVLNSESGSREETYTKRHTLARSGIERCFGLLKSRWRCLLRHRALHYNPTKCGKIVNACAILHNICISAAVPLPNLIEEDDEIHNVAVDTSQTELIQGRSILNNLLARL